MITMKPIQKHTDRATDLRHLTKDYLDVIFVSVAVAVSLFFLFYRISGFLPPYPWSDETMIAADAVETLTQGPKLLYPNQLAGGSLAIWLEAIHIATFGKSLLGLRILNALINVAVVAGTYALTRLILSSEGRLFSQFTALLTSVSLASSLWILAVGRIAFTNFGLTPLMTITSFCPLWRGLQTGKSLPFVLSGALLGLSLYGYVPSVFIPLVIVAFFVIEWFISKLDRRISLIRQYWRQFLYLAVAATFFALPLALSFLANLDLYLRRPAHIAAVNQVFGIQRVLQTLADTAASFGLLPTWLLDGRWDRLVFDPPTAVLFVVGILIVLSHLRRPANLFLLVWWLVALLPAILSASASVWVFDLMRRGINSQPVSFIFPSLALMTIGRWLWRRRPAVASVAVPAVVVGLLVFSGVNSYQFFFRDWISRPETQNLFVRQPMQLTDWMTSNGTADMVYVIPLRLGASPTTRPELFAVRTYYEGKAEIAYVDFDEPVLASALTTVCAGKSTVNLMLLQRIDLDPKGYLHFLLEQHGTLVDDQSRFGYRIGTYRLNSDNEDFAETGNEVPVDVQFGNALRLVYANVSDTRIQAGNTLWLTLHWSALHDIDRDYNVGLSLVDSYDYVIARTDKPLLSDQLRQTTSHWTTGERARDFYQLPVPATTPPGNYVLRAVVYDATVGDGVSGRRLAPEGGELADLSLPFIQIETTLAALPVDPASVAVGDQVDLPVTDDLQIVGVLLSSRQAKPGDQLRTTITWQALAKPRQDYGLVLGLADGETLEVTTELQPLASTSYPTSKWRTGELLQVNYPFLLPPDLTTGEYALIVQLVDLDTGDPVSEAQLQQLRVEARTHNFSDPTPSRRLEVDFGNSIRLLGYEEPLFAQADHILVVQLYWQALAEMTESYKVFVHVVDESGSILAQADVVPGEGSAPTTSWIKEEIIADTIRVSLPETMRPGRYRLLIGLYDSGTGQRLPLEGTEGIDTTLVLWEITV